MTAAAQYDDGLTDELDYVGKLIDALSLMRGKRDQRREYLPGLWLLTVRSIASALVVETTARYGLYLEDLAQVELHESAADRDVVAEVRRVILGEDVPRPGIPVAQVIATMLGALDAGPGGGGL
ncbi:MAG TPA: hypothetical protein VL551_35005 [Actinospica sp.]|nr:hypothetical protein [Actinospica sp.]